MGFCGEIQDAGELVLFDEPGGERLVKDVSFYNGEAGIVIGPDEVISVARVGEFIEDDEFFDFGSLQNFSDQSRADETSTTGEQ